MFFSRKRVGIFGGSFDPPHIGHTAICRWLFDRDIVDELWVVPCFIHPFGKGLSPFDDRLLMCKLALYKLDYDIRVLDIEKRLGGVSYTLRTIEHLKAAHRSVRLKLVAGDDVRAQKEKWHGHDKIVELADIIEVPRGPGSPIPNISSSAIRQKIKDGLAFANMVESEIAVYVTIKGLYRGAALNNL